MIEHNNPKHMPFNEAYDKNYYAALLQRHGRKDAHRFTFGTTEVRVIPLNDRPDEWLVEKYINGERFNYMEPTDKAAQMLADMHVTAGKTHREHWYTAFRQMLEGDGERLTASDDFKDVCSQWAVMTTENDHNGVLIEVSRFFRLEYYKRQMEDIMERHLAHGSMKFEWIDERNKAEHDILDNIERRYGKPVADMVRQAL